MGCKERNRTKKTVIEMEREEKRGGDFSNRKRLSDLWWGAWIATS